MDSTADANGAKRKRSPSDLLPQSRPAPSTPSAASPNAAGQINYLTCQKSEKLKLVEGDDETLSGVLQLLDEYDGVLQRRESLAANLGATLVGPLLLNAFENYFQNPLVHLATTPKGGPVEPISWVDVVNFAREHPDQFFLENYQQGENADTTGPQEKVCRIWIRNTRVQISEHDWRLIVSGVPARMLPEQLNPEDENAEMVTLDILEARFSVLVKKADAVAARTRLLVHHIKDRKTAIMARRGGPMQTPGLDQQINPTTGEWAQQSNNSPYGAMAPNPQDLLRQFSLFQQDPATPTASRSQVGSNKKLKTSASGHLTNPSFTSINQTNARTTSSPNPRSKKDPKSLLEDPPYKALMVSHIEKLNRGDPIWPPCDRCRRLKMECTKNYTACLGCTKKHCKCFFREVDQSEIMVAGLEVESEAEAQSEAADRKPKTNDAAVMTNTAVRSIENMSSFGQEPKDVEMRGAGNSTPGSANNDSRSFAYGGPGGAPYSAADSTQSSNGAAATSNYPSGHQTAMIANMTGPGSTTEGSNHGVYGMSANYPVPAPVEQNEGVASHDAESPATIAMPDNYGHQHPQVVASHDAESPATIPMPDNYGRQHPQGVPSREAQSKQIRDVNYIRPITGEGDAVMRDVYTMPSDPSQSDQRTSNMPTQQREIQEPNTTFFAEMTRYNEGAAAHGSGAQETGNSPST